MAFHFIASTGRTATTYIAAALNALPGVVACHEGYAGSDKDAEPLLPLINLENARAYQLPSSAEATVAEKRSPEIIADALAQSGAETLIDIAYYNPMFASAMLAAHPQAKMIGIIRDCESFVRSSTTLEGEDPMPVGWADPAKPLTRREEFIALGRIKPRRKTDDKAAWDGWSAIQRNIWLWRETNLRLIEAQSTFPERVLILPFERLKQDPQHFWDAIASHLDLPEISEKAHHGKGKFTNTKAFGYQIEAAAAWSADERQLLHESVEQVEEKLAHVS